jgi:hypothetical protein
MATSYSPRIVTDGLVLHLDVANRKSYSGSGTAWNDLSGNTNHATLVNSPVFSGEAGGILNFNEVTNYASISDSSTLNVTTTRTWEFWLRFTDFSGTALMYMYSQNTFRADNSINLFVGEGITNHYQYRLACQLRTNASNEFEAHTTDTVNTVLGDGKLHQITIVRTGAATVNFYIDGVQWTTSYFALIGSPGEVDPTGGLNIARRVDGDAARYFGGDIGKFLVYNRALTAAEILQNYNAIRGRFGV